MRLGQHVDLCLVALERSELGRRTREIRDQALSIAMRRSAEFNLPLVLQEADLLCAALSFPGGEAFVSEYLHPELQP